MCAKVIHFGCGALGLGLTIPILKDFPDCEIYLSNRRSSEVEKNAKSELLKSSKCYNVICDNKETIINIEDFVYFDELERLKQIVIQDDYLFITTALKENGIKDNISLFATLIKSRNETKIRKPLVFIACENAICSTDIERLIKDFLKIDHKSNFKNPEILFLDCVVDRMCNSPFILAGKLNVVVEKYCSWIVNPYHFKRKLVYNDPNYVFLIKQLHDQLSDDLEFFYDIQLYVRRKKWIINSLHQMIALYAHYNNRNLINLFVHSVKGKKVVHTLANNVLKMYLHNEPNAKEDEIIDYILKFIERVTQFPSLTSTALTRFQREEDLQAFIADYHRKTAQPALKYIQDTNYDLPAVNKLLLMIVDMISHKKFVGK